MRANIGAERYVPGWDNFDVVGLPGMHIWDIRSPWGVEKPDYDYAVCHHVLTQLSHHELVPALRNIRAILKPGGWLRISDTNILGGIKARENGDRAWFPQDDRIGSVDAAFCTWATWFGTLKSVFTPAYLLEMMEEAGWQHFDLGVHAGRTRSGCEGICLLDRAPHAESFFVEAQT